MPSDPPPSPEGRIDPPAGSEVLPDLDEGVDAQELGAERHQRDGALVRAVLADLAPADCDALSLAFGQGFGAAEIAVTLGISVRRAQLAMDVARAHFESRSIAVVLSSQARVSCPGLVELVGGVQERGATLSARQCDLVAEHGSSCAACSETLAEWNVGAELLAVLAVEVEDMPKPARIDAGFNARRAWRITRPVAVLGSAAAVVAIAGTAVAVSQHAGHQASGQPPAAPVVSARSAAATASPSAVPASPTPSATPSHQPSPSVITQPAVTRPSPSASPRPPLPSPSASPTPSATSSPSPSPSATSSTTVATP